MITLAHGETFRVIEAAITDPASLCKRIPSESEECWQTRAVMAALGRLEERSRPVNAR